MGGFRHETTFLAIGAVALLGGQIASVQSTGEARFINSCSACHGADGKGAGPIVGYLTGSMPDLTQLSANNGGAFPITKFYSTIDGTMTSGSHGSREMSVWAQRYLVRGEQGASPDFQASQSEVSVKFRILALTECLSSIQE